MLLHSLHAAMKIWRWISSFVRLHKDPLSSGFVNATVIPRIGCYTTDWLLYHGLAVIPRIGCYTIDWVSMTFVKSVL